MFCHILSWLNVNPYGMNIIIENAAKIGIDTFLFTNTYSNWTQRKILYLRFSISNFCQTRLNNNHKLNFNQLHLITSSKKNQIISIMCKINNLQRAENLRAIKISKIFLSDPTHRVQKTRFKIPTFSPSDAISGAQFELSYWKLYFI